MRNHFFAALFSINFMNIYYKYIKKGHKCPFPQKLCIFIFMLLSEASSFYYGIYISYAQ